MTGIRCLPKRLEEPTYQMWPSYPGKALHISWKTQFVLSKWEGGKPQADFRASIQPIFSNPVVYIYLLVCPLPQSSQSPEWSQYQSKKASSDHKTSSENLAFITPQRDMLQNIDPFVTDMKWADEVYSSPKGPCKGIPPNIAQTSTPSIAETQQRDGLGPLKTPWSSMWFQCHMTRVFSRFCRYILYFDFIFYAVICLWWLVIGCSTAFPGFWLVSVGALSFSCLCVWTESFCIFSFVCTYIFLFMTII